MTHSVLAFIPARGGSKGVPHKNRRVVAGRPLIDYTIDAALAANSIDRVVVSTDDPAIAQIASRRGVDVVERPPNISGDTSPVVDAVRHALSELVKSRGTQFDAVVLLQPTSPLRAAGDIDRAVDVYFTNGMTPVCSVYRCEDNHPARMYKIVNGRLASLMPEFSGFRRQDLPDVYHRNGCLYVFGAAEVRSGNIIADSMLPYVMDQMSSINVDTEVDLLLLEAVMGRK